MDGLDKVFMENTQKIIDEGSPYFDPRCRYLNVCGRKIGPYPGSDDAFGARPGNGWDNAVRAWEEKQ